MIFALTTVGDQFLAIDQLRKCPLAGFSLGMAIPLSDGNRAMASDVGECEGIVSRLGKPRQRRVPQAVRLKPLDFWNGRFNIVRFGQIPKRTIMLQLGAGLFQML